MADEIIRNLGLGGLKDAYDMVPRGYRNICVLEYTEILPPGTISIPILSTQTGKALTRQLNRAASVIDQLLKEGDRVLVHCAMGIERSPLTVAYYLVRTGFAENIQEAYH